MCKYKVFNTLKGLHKAGKCEKGFNCRNTTQPYLCSNGTYSNSNNTDCLLCELGSYCSNGIKIECDKTLCNQTGLEQALSCPKGNQCTNGIRYERG